jgi:hypothetical protein
MTCLADKYLIPKELKKTTHYNDDQRANVKILYEKGNSIRSISREIPMSRRMVQFILFPERALLAKTNFAKRQKEGRYRYPTPIQTKLVQQVRSRKRKMLDKLIKKT